MTIYPLRFAPQFSVCDELIQVRVISEIHELGFFILGYIGFLGDGIFVYFPMAVIKLIILFSTDIF
jgi:hypothetical protein